MISPNLYFVDILLMCQPTAGKMGVRFPHPQNVSSCLTWLIQKPQGAKLFPALFSVRLKQTGHLEGCYLRYYCPFAWLSTCLVDPSLLSHNLLRVPESQPVAHMASPGWSGACDTSLEPGTWVTPWLYCVFTVCPRAWRLCEPHFSHL